MTKNKLFITSLFITIFYIIITSKIMLDASTHDTKGLFFSFILLILALMPNLLFSVSIYKYKDFLPQFILVLLQAISCLFFIYIYYDAFYLHPDALNGVVFLVFPFLHFILVGGAIIAIEIIRLITDLFRA